MARTTFQGPVKSDNGFIAQPYVVMLIYADETAAAIEAFRAYVPPPP